MPILYLNLNISPQATFLKIFKIKKTINNKLTCRLVNVSQPLVKILVFDDS